MGIVRPVVLSGGSGTRLWPVSTSSRPKQFLDLLGEPMIEATLGRLRGMEGVGPVTVVTGGDHAQAVEEAARRASIDLGAVVVEPAGRNTGPAVVVAALLGDPDDVLVIVPADHRIADVEAFRAAVERAVGLARDGALVTFGARPTRPDTGYGYIEQGEPFDGAFQVARFKEKPDEEEASRLFADGRHLWNSGMFVFTARRLLEEAALHEPALLEGAKAALPEERTGRVVLSGSFATIAPISIDHAVMEKTAGAVVIPIDVGWTDVGSWESVWELSEHDSSGNVLIGDVTAIDVTGCYVLAGSRKVAVAGVEGVIVVETPEAVLVVGRSQAQLVRDLAQEAGEDRPD
ncbi:MAG TPA: mannose-1-phosphate guanylyltransferase [Acidimicrobiia bacterium]